ncbi:hypothetical protein JCM10213_000162 [Rhodosporidiobolus nylandii]
MATHHGFIKEFPFVRVDAFDGGADLAAANPYDGKAPHFYLLTHAHTDHIGGLHAKNFNGQIYATPMTKQLLLETMTASDRVHYEEVRGTSKTYKFANLKPPRKGGKSGFDRIKEIPYNTPTRIAGPAGMEVTVTALDANHCPGSAMFLIDGTGPLGRRCVLHTGDIRAEDWWLEALKHNPHVQPYLGPPPLPPVRQASRKGKEKATEEESLIIEEERTRAGKTLDCIYIDTSSTLDEELVPKAEAASGLVQLVSQYPAGTRFFINGWTWGYEDLYKALYQAFGEQIHFNKYKHCIYTSEPFQAGEPLLSLLSTTSAYPPSHANPSPSLHASTSARPSSPSSIPLRFHACERRWRCDHVWAGGIGCYEWATQYLPLLSGPKQLKTAEKRCLDGDEDSRIVFVNPSEMPRWAWKEYREGVDKRFERYWAVQEDGGKGKKRAAPEDGEATLPEALIIPLARHSTRPELQRLVALFRPRTVFPLTLPKPEAKDFDASRKYVAHAYRDLFSIFGPHLATGGEAQLKAEVKAYEKSVKASRFRFEPSSQDEFENGALVEPRWVREMQQMGMNVEGGKEVWHEVVRWEKRFKEKRETNEEDSPRASKRRRVEGEPNQAEVLVIDSDDEDLADPEVDSPVTAVLASSPPPAAASTSQPIPGRNYDASRRKAEFARRPSPFLDAASASNTLLQPASIDSQTPPLRSAMKRCDRTPEPSDIPATLLSTGRQLCKSVTFAASPSPKQVITLRSAAIATVSSPELGVGRPTPLATTVKPGAFFSSSSDAPSPQFPLRMPSSAYAPTPASSAMSSPPANSPACEPAGPGPLPSSSSLAIAPTSHGPVITARPSSDPEARERRHLVIKAFRRQTRGMISKDGGRIVPFAEGDERLGGRRPLRLKPAKEGKGKERAWETPKDERALREKQDVAPSPSSFRTVGASASP